jgi:hypothetical protein
MHRVTLLTLYYKFMHQRWSTLQTLQTHVQYLRRQLSLNRALTTVYIEWQTIIKLCIDFIFIIIAQFKSQIHQIL